jgi:hypothetical protein
MIYGPKNDGAYIVEFRTADGEALAISVPASEIARIEAFPEADALRAVRARCGRRRHLIARATRQRARPRWRRSPRAGGESDNIPIRRNAHRATLPVGVESGLDLIEPPVQHKTNPERQNHDQQHHFDAHADAPDPVG